MGSGRDAGPTNTGGGGGSGGGVGGPIGLGEKLLEF